MNRIVLYIILFVVSSCAIKGNFNGLYHNNFKYTSTYFECKNGTPNIYLINGEILRNCIINNNEKALIYIWDLHCQSDNCVNISFFMEFCKERDIKPYIIVEYVTDEDIQYYASLGIDLYVIDNKFYKTNLVSTYVNRFTYDIALHKVPVGERYLFFDDNKNVISSRTLSFFNKQS